MFDIRRNANQRGFPPPLPPSPHLFEAIWNQSEAMGKHRQCCRCFLVASDQAQMATNRPEQGGWGVYMLAKCRILIHCLYDTRKPGYGRRRYTEGTPCVDATHNQAVLCHRSNELKADNLPKHTYFSSVLFLNNNCRSQICFVIHNIISKCLLYQQHQN